MMPDPAADDVEAVIDEGDLVPYLLSLTGRTRKRAALVPVADEPAEAEPDVPPRKPGAWPVGTRPATPAPPPEHDFTEAEIARAIAEYRVWHQAGEPVGTFRCECDSCRLLDGPN